MQLRGDVLGLSRIYYLLKDGGLSADEGVFRFDNAEGMVRIPIERVAAFEIHGGCNITSGALKLAGEFNIPIHVFGFYGNYMGTYWPKEKFFSGDLTIKQSLYFSDNEKRKDLSYRLVQGTIDNMVSLMKRFDGDTRDIDRPIKGASIEDLMLMEARARREYFARLDQIIPEDFMLMSRDKRPPTNYGNALISFGNSLLYSALVTEARKTSVNITIPFYHAPSAGRFALALDLAEPFKPGLVDRFVIQVTKQGMIKPSDEHFAREGNGIMLNAAGRKVFLEQWDKWLDVSNQHERLRRKVSNRELLRLEIHKYAKEVEGLESYQPVQLPVD
jgi:CRISPR-associated protein Cas1